MSVRGATCVGCAQGFDPSDPAQVRCNRCMLQIIDAAATLPTMAVVAAIEEAGRVPGWRTAVTPEQMVRLLNEALAADPQAITALVSTAVECNEALTGHPTIRIFVDPEEPDKRWVRALGLINGVFGLRDGWGIIGRADKKNIAEIQQFVLVRDELGGGGD